MKWWQAEISTSEEAQDSVTESLLELGAVGVATEDPFDLKIAYESSNETTFFDPSYLEDLDEYVKIRAYFPTYGDQVRYGYRVPDDEKLTTNELIRLYDQRDYNQVGVAEFTKMLERELSRIGEFLDVSPAIVKGALIDEKDWANQWRNYYQTIRISDRLIVKPSWEDYKAGQEEKVIVLDPGSAFGTGTHESTRLSLMALDRFMVEGAKVLDLGTGSGILAIGAALLGARRVDACDIDPHSVSVCDENVRINKMQDKVNSFVGELKDTEGSYDLIAANLLADVHINLVHEIRPKLNDLGLYMAGGIIADRKDDVVNSFRKAGLGLHHSKEMNDWYLLVFHKSV